MMELTGGSDFYCSKFETGEGLVLCSLKAPLENKGHLNRADRVITLSVLATEEAMKPILA